jgi:hypothetical protein
METDEYEAYSKVSVSIDFGGKVAFQSSQAAT